MIDNKRNNRGSEQELSRREVWSRRRIFQAAPIETEVDGGEPSTIDGRYFAEMPAAPANVSQVTQVGLLRHCTSMSVIKKVLREPKISKGGVWRFASPGRKGTGCSYQQGAVMTDVEDEHCIKSLKSLSREGVDDLFYKI